MRNPARFLRLTVLLLLVSSQLVMHSRAHATGTTRYVAPAGVTSGTCETWGTACELQYALGLAVSDDSLWVQQGTYTPGALRTSTFTLKNGVSIYGGFDGTEGDISLRNPTTHVTTLSGNIGDAGIDADNVYHVVSGGGTNSSARLDGFTITAGNADGSYPDFKGGGIYNSSSSPTLANLVITDNTASEGGGMFNTSSSPSLTDVTLSLNHAGSGAGMHNHSSSNPVLLRVVFANNSATGSGGGLSNSTSSPSLTDVTFRENSAAFGGAALLSSGDPVFSRVTFSGNTAYDGAAIYQLVGNSTFTNVTFTANSASAHGGAAYLGTDGAVTLKNATLSANSAASSGGGGIYTVSDLFSYLSNSVLWNSAGDVYVGGGLGVLQITDGIMYGGCPALGGINCVNVSGSDPLLGSLQNNGGFTQTMTLQMGSPAIDAGTSTDAPATDQRGILRPQDGDGDGVLAIDIGATESQYRTRTFKSLASSDGWVLESGENTSVGGSRNSSDTVFRLGDDAIDWQYRAILSFGTSSLPDNAELASVKLKIRQRGVTGGNPFLSLGSIKLDLRKGAFGNSASLQNVDFQAAAHLNGFASITNNPVSGWYTKNLPVSALPEINLTGSTQFRLRFATGDNDNWGDDYIRFHSGNAAGGSRPRLIIEYYVP